MSFKPTDEQVAITDAAKDGGNGVVEAGAGTGKTTTLKGISKALPTNKVLYIAYNKSVQVEAAASFPRNTRCKTGHALAYQSHAVPMKHRLNGPRQTSKVLCGVMGIKDSFQIDADTALKPWQLARLALDTVKRFTYSADRHVHRKHVPFVPGAESVMDDLREFLLPHAERAWQDKCNPNGRLPFLHDDYLKQWCLTDPVLNFDTILYDEAQDANPAIEAVIRAQDAQKVYVGDRCQAIYAWRGAEDAMSKFDADWRHVLSQSFRFGPAVANEANKWLDLLDAPLRLTGFDGIDSIVTQLDDPTAILARTNATVVAEAMQAQQQGRKVAIVGGTSEIKAFARGADDLLNGKQTSHPDLMAFKNWGEVQQYVREDEGGTDLKVFVKLVDDYGVNAVMQVADEAVDEANADLIVSTAHKSKGREFHKVRIAPDFKEPKEGEQPSRPEAMLAYVAVTRAQYVLDPLGLDWIDNFQTAAHVEA